MEENIHHHFMKEALKQARLALAKGEVPVGAVIVFNNKVIARAHNQAEMLHDPTAHAEMIAMTQASETLSENRPDHRGSLEGASIYVTMEPCSMCAGALVLTKCTSLIFGTLDAKFGACQSLYRITEDERLNHRLKVTGGIMADESKATLREFFKGLRKEKR